MTDKEIRDRLDYKEGDIVQITKGERAGKLGKIIRIRPFSVADELCYCLIIDGEIVDGLSAHKIKFINREE